MMTGVTNILVGASNPKTLHPDVDWLEKALKENNPIPKLVTVVNPGNPSGAFIPKPMLQRISDVCINAGAWLVVDNTYDELRRRRDRTIWCCFLDVVEELIKSGNVIEAIYIAHEIGLLERFPPVPLLKSYIRQSSEKAQAVLRNGRCSGSAVEESNSLECNACKSVIRCIEACQLLSVFNIDGLKKVAMMEKEKADRKKHVMCDWRWIWFLDTVKIY